GNPDHPGSPGPVGSPEATRFGPTDVFAQASLLTLYDPDRSAAVTQLGNIGTFDAFVAALHAAMRPRGERTRIRILTQAVTSPTLAHQLRRLIERFPQAKWYSHDPIDRANVVRGAR